MHFGGAAMNKREYSDDEAREILKRAVDYQERDDFKYSEQQLLDLGREMGLSQDAIVKAQQDFGVGAESPVRAKGTSGTGAKEKPQVSAEEAAFRRERMMPFYIHLAVFIPCIILVLFINMITSMAFPWSLIVFFGWLPGLVGHYMTIARTEGNEYEDAFDDWVDNQKARQRKRQRRLEEGRSE
jgi:hypothetical protein